MDKAKIAKLCNEIEDIACDISQQTMNDIVSAESRMIFDKAKEIAAEISAHPKTNADRIRQMTDEELVEVLRCKCCDFNNKPECASIDCKEGHMIWLKHEASEDEND
jgi:hypothetical protein